MRPASGALACLAACAALATLAGIFTLPTAAAAADFHITLTTGGAPAFESAGNVTATVQREQPGELVEWRINSTQERVVGTVANHGYFANLERARQMVPEADDHYFAEVFTPDVNDSAPWARVINFTSPGGPAFSYALAFPVNGSAVLRLTRDLQAPTYEVPPIQNLTHNMFFVETRTGEYAYGNLIIQRDPGGDPVLNPTTVPSLFQRFPVQGLNSDTDYVFRVEFTDWAGNKNVSPPVRLHTLPAPVLPAPVVTAREPAPNATLAAPVTLIAINYTGDLAPGDAITIFLDKVPYHDAPRILDHRVEIVPYKAFGPGHHSIGIELLGAEGGRTVDRWTFDVATPTPPAPDMLLFGAIALLALAAGRRKG